MLTNSESLRGGSLILTVGDAWSCCAACGGRQEQIDSFSCSLTPKDGVRRGGSWVKKRRRAPRSLEIIQHVLQGTQSDCPLSGDKDTGCQKDIPVLSSKCEVEAGTEEGSAVN